MVATAVDSQIGAMKPARMPSTASVREFCTTASTPMPAISSTLIANAGSASIRS